MVSLFLILGLVLGCTQESGSFQTSQADSEIKSLEPAEMRRFIELNYEFLQGIRRNTLFNPAGLIEGKIKGGKLFRIIPSNKVIDAAKLNSGSTWDNSILREVLKSSPLEEDLKGEVIVTPFLFFSAAKHPLLFNALGFFDIDNTLGLFEIDKAGIWMPNAVELTGRAQVLNKYLPDDHRFITKFYPSNGKESGEEYLEIFAKCLSLPLVDVNISALSMHDWTHLMTILYPPWLIKSYQFYAQDILDFIQYLRKRNFFDKFNSLFNIGQNRYGETHWKDIVINHLYNRVGRDIDAQLGNFQNSLRSSRYEYTNPKPENITNILKLTFKDRVLNYFRNLNQGSVSSDQSQQLQKAIEKEMDKFLKQRKDIKERIYFNKNKEYASEEEMAQDVNNHIDYIAQILADNPAAQKELIEGSVVKPTGNLKEKDLEKISD
jgi:hypothetical protein